jgi:hypothetical protein
MKASHSFLHLDKARPHLALDKHDRCGIKRLSHLPTVRPWLHAISSHSDIFDNPLRDTSSTISLQGKDACPKS